MKYDQHLITTSSTDYELLDSGENMKLERFGRVVVARPETQALWKKARPELWKTAQAVFAFGEKKGAWDVKDSLPKDWVVSFNDARANAKLTSFKHTGIFPEQAPNWEWSSEKILKLDKPNVLNLFGYTGIASIAAAQAGAFVTHVDASKQSVEWAKANSKLSSIDDKAIRWVIEDALAFAKREVRRGAKYDGIILDPPAFGRGAKHEVWKIEEALPELLTALKDLLSDKPGSFFLLNGYAAGYAPLSFAQAIESVFGSTNGPSTSLGASECGELHIKESSSDRVIPAGIYVRFVR